MKLYCACGEQEEEDGYFYCFINGKGHEEKLCLVCAEPALDEQDLACSGIILDEGCSPALGPMGELKRYLDEINKR